MIYIEVTASWGTISEYATKMINRFKHFREVNPELEFQVKGDFNGVILYVDENSNVESIVNDYNVGFQKNVEEYKKTNEYKERKIQREEEIKQLQLEADEKIEEFKNMDKTDELTLLQWLSDFQRYSDRIGIHTDSQFILDELKALGYTSRMNCGNSFNGKDKDNFTGYIVGQCISCLERVGAIHQVVCNFVDNWKKEFIV